MYLEQQPSIGNNNNNNNNTIRALDLPEIRLTIAAHLPPRHCVPCLLVCKAWYTSFLLRIWRSPNLYPYPLTSKNSYFSSALVAKHGHLIQEIGPLFCGKQLSFLVDAHLTGLKCVTVHQLRTLPDKEAFDKVLLRQRQLGVVLKLEEFESHGHAVDADTLVALGILPFVPPSSEETISVARLMFPAMAYNSLRCLTLEKLDMDHTTFSDILQYSPHLSDISLNKVVFTSPLSFSSDTPLFMSSSVRTISATIQQILHLGHQDFVPPSLLAHFSNLTTWRIFPLDFLDTDIKSTLVQALHNAVNTYCPLLTDLDFRWGTTSLVNSLLAGAFSGVKARKIKFTYDRSRNNCSLDGLMPGILKHANSLVSITLSAFTLRPYNNNSPTPPPSPQLDSSDTMFAKLMRSCPRLRVLSIPPYTASIESFEHGEEWACQGLETLRVGIQGLDDVDTCLTKLKTLRNNTTWQSSGQVKIDGETIGDRVIKRLVTLYRLKTVWLGTKDVYLATIS
ncbi:hypothetical protein BGZ47_011099 [Haplosporangium gracile]|nr:hypothetical protein BGZ47_011099 [Haplosporangium gracile]